MLMWHVRTVQSDLYKTSKLQAGETAPHPWPRQHKKSWILLSKQSSRFCQNLILTTEASGHLNLSYLHYYYSMNRDNMQVNQWWELLRAVFGLQNRARTWLRHHHAYRQQQTGSQCRKILHRRVWQKNGCKVNSRNAVSVKADKCVWEWEQTSVCVREQISVWGVSERISTSALLMFNTLLFLIFVSSLTLKRCWSSCCRLRPAALGVCHKIREETRPAVEALWQLACSS